MEKAALVMAKVLIVYRVRVNPPSISFFVSNDCSNPWESSQERLGNEHKLTKLTRRQLSEILERVKVLGSKALQDAFSGIATDENYKVRFETSSHSCMRRGVDVDEGRIRRSHNIS